MFFLGDYGDYLKLLEGNSALGFNPQADPIGDNQVKIPTYQVKKMGLNIVFGFFYRIFRVMFLEVEVEPVKNIGKCMKEAQVLIL